MNKPTEFAYRALLRDLAHNEPRHGYETYADIELTNDQAATVVRHFPEVVAEALAAMPMQFALVLDSPSAESCTLFCSLLTLQVKHEAKKNILYDLQTECEEARRAAKNDDHYHRRVL
jgi:hypothetical protein